ncbi:MAG TPA: C4-type zinc ribbon domain-containing protein [Dehalococcoidia bacterium]|nr:C4-type zinc ribbon domain-containing protein [Dehalococcoidia bacterium]
MSLVSDLWALQEIDVALDARRASLEDAEARLGETDELREARDRARTAEEALQRARSAQKDIDLEAEELRARIKDLDAKLYSGSIRQPKELADLQADVESLRRQLATIEDRDLDAMSSVEAAEREAAAARDDAARIEAAWRAEQQELQDRAARLRVEIAEYDARRRDEETAVPADVLRTYDRLRAARNGRAVAKLDRNICLGCRISLPQNTVTRARGGSALVHCPNCERILMA